MFFDPYPRFFCCCFDIVLVLNDGAALGPTHSIEQCELLVLEMGYALWLLSNVMLSKNVRHVSIGSWTYIIPCEYPVTLLARWTFFSVFVTGLSSSSQNFVLTGVCNCPLPIYVRAGRPLKSVIMVSCVSGHLLEINIDLHENLLYCFSVGFYPSGIVPAKWYCVRWANLSDCYLFWVSK